MNMFRERTGMASTRTTRLRVPASSGSVVARRAGSTCAVTVLAGCLLTAGCTGSGKGGAMEPLKPRGMSYLAEVPVPQGFSKVDSGSWDHESGGQRMAEHVYRGSAAPEAVRTFYREQMPRTGWQCLSDQNFEGLTSIRFEKHSEACTVAIKSDSLNRTVVKVMVVPFSRTPMEPPKRPTR